MWVYLYEQWYGLHAGDLSSVYGVSGHDVKCSRAALYDFLHANPILITEIVKNRNKPAYLTPTVVLQLLCFSSADFW